MALDWNKDISFTGSKRSSKKASTAYPEKGYMNLAVQERRPQDTRRTVLTAILVVVLVAFVLKFGVYDFYAKLAAKQVELNSQTQVLNSYQQQLADYDEVLDEYRTYESVDISENGLPVDALDALALVDKWVTPYARVSSLVLDGGSLELRLSNTTLEQVGKLSSDLEQQPIVASVQVDTATTQQSSDGEVSATVTVMLQAVADEGQGA